MDPDQIGAFRGFLEYGPLGFAGLALVLAVFGLVAVDLDENRYRLLRLVLFTGTFGLVAMLIADYFSIDAEHEMRVGVWPLDGDINRESFPVPLVKVDEVEIDRTEPYFVSDDIVVLVDVSRAIEVIKAAQGQITQSTEAFSEISARLEELEENLEDVQSNSGTEGLKVARQVSNSISSISRLVDPRLAAEIRELQNGIVE